MAIGFNDIGRKIQSGYFDVSEFGLMAQDSFGILPLGWAIGLAMTVVIGLPIGYAITFALTRMRFENLIIYSALGAAACALIGKAMFFDDRELMVAYITNGLVLGAGFWTFCPQAYTGQHQWLIANPKSVSRPCRPTSIHMRGFSVAG